jgi:hypothetical protein
MQVKGRKSERHISSFTMNPSSIVSTLSYLVILEYEFGIPLCRFINTSWIEKFPSIIVVEFSVCQKISSKCTEKLAGEWEKQTWNPWNLMPEKKTKKDKKKRLNIWNWKHQYKVTSHVACDYNILFASKK